jgi:N6-adenosine-specific RNA methylase IME4
MSTLEERCGKAAGGGVDLSRAEDEPHQAGRVPQAAVIFEIHYESHELANLFPRLEGPEFEALVDDIRLHDLREDIVLYEHKILDGRNRYLACLAAGVTPRFSVFEPKLHGNPIDYVISRNLMRRHLSESQRAMLAAKLANLGHGGDRRSTDQAANLPLEISQSKAAAILQVSERSVRSAKVVQAKGGKALARAVEKGKLSVSEAANAATSLDQEGQHRVAELAIAGDAKAARTLVKQGTRQAQMAKLGTPPAPGNLALPAKRYGAILIDPQWADETWGEGPDVHAVHHRRVASTAEIAAIPVGDIAARDCVVFLWTTQATLPGALMLMSGWGFAYRSHFVWKKIYPDSRAGPDDLSCSVHELLLVGTRGTIPAPAPRTRCLSVFSGPVRMHSIKPDEQYKLIEAYYPDLLKIEINARRARPGWDCWDAKAGAPLVAPSSELLASKLATAQFPVAVATMADHPLDILR